MEKQQDQQIPDEQPGYDFDDIRRLHVGPIEQAAAAIRTEVGDFPGRLSGEILFDGQQGSEGFIVEGLRRLALVGGLERPEDDPKVGTLSLAGPLQTPELAPGPYGRVEGVPFQLHYAALSELPPRIQGDHAVFPQVETILVDIEWKPVGDGQAGVLLRISASQPEAASKLQGYTQLVHVRSLLLENVEVTLAQAGSGPPRPEPHHSLQSNCPSPGGACAPGKATVVRTLPVKFVNFSTHANIEAICNAQINGVCTVWRQKAALDLVVDPLLVNATALTAYRVLDTQEENNIHTQGFQNPLALEIYMIDTFINPHGGGITYGAGTGDAYIILEAVAADANPTLLAHELGHALGLAHTDGSQGFLVSSQGSVMETSTPNPSLNSLCNCRIFKCCTPPLLPLVATSTTPDCFRPDGDFFIRDFPADNGAEPSIAPAGFNHWGSANLWNRRSSSMGGLNAAGAPQHEDPFCTDATNHMFVRLEYSGTLRDPVAVDLYLAAPGLSPAATPLTPLNAAGNRINFPLPAVNPNTLSLAWSPQALAAAFPAHSCAFAVAHCVEDCTLCPAPAALTFGQVLPLVVNSNKVAQRNLNFLGCTPAGGLPLWVWLPWLQIANPFLKNVDISLEVDARSAGRLASLEAVLDNQDPYLLVPGERAAFELPEAFTPERVAALRLRAQLPQEAAMGEAFPIGVHFFAGGQPVLGYEYVIQVQPLVQATLQVIDRLAGALLAVAAICPTPQAKDVQEKMSALLQEIQDPPDQALEALAQLATDVAALGNSLDPAADGCQTARDGLLLLAQALETPAGERNGAWLERLRGLADHIHEPASRRLRTAG